MRAINLSVDQTLRAIVRTTRASVRQIMNRAAPAAAVLAYLLNDSLSSV